MDPLTKVLVKTTTETLSEQHNHIHPTTDQQWSALASMVMIAWVCIAFVMYILAHIMSWQRDDWPHAKPYSIISL